MYWPPKVSAAERQIKWESGICTGCGEKEVVSKTPREGRKRREGQSYYYTKYWKCESCKRVFMDERYKRLIDSKDLPDRQPVVEPLFFPPDSD